MQHPQPVARRMFDLTEPISLVNFFADEPNEAMAALGFRNYWDGYFAGRAAPLGRVPAEVVHAAFYSFADGEAARHIPKVWDTTTPEAAHAARERGCVASLRRILGDLVETPGPGARRRAPRQGLDERADRRTGHVRRAAHAPDARGAGRPALARREHAARAPRGRPHRRAGLRAHRRHRGPRAQRPGHGIYPAESFGRIHHLPKARLAEVMDGLRDRGLVDASGRFTEAGRATKHRIEALTDDLAEAPYDGLAPAELDELIAVLEPISARLQATGSQ